MQSGDEFGSGLTTCSAPFTHHWAVGLNITEIDNISKHIWTSVTCDLPFSKCRHLVVLYVKSTWNSLSAGVNLSRKTLNGTEPIVTVPFYEIFFCLSEVPLWHTAGRLTNSDNFRRFLVLYQQILAKINNGSLWDLFLVFKGCMEIY